MNEPDVKAIKEYAKSCRQRVDGFLEKHYSFGDSFRAQLKEINSALWQLPLNALWAIPYITLKKTAETVDKLGWGLPVYLMEHVPSGFHIALQDHIEKKVSQEIFAVSKGIGHTTLVKKELKKYAIGRTVAANLSMAMTVPVMGWIILGDRTLSLAPMIDKIAVSYATDRQANDFVFGKSLGEAFYGVFTPQATWMDYAISILIFYIFLTTVSFAVQVLFSPVRKVLGLEKKKLLSMVDHIEEKLILAAHGNEPKGH
jgi:hypothetical protein